MWSSEFETNLESFPHKSLCEDPAWDTAIEQLLEPIGWAKIKFIFVLPVSSIFTDTQA